MKHLNFFLFLIILSSVACSLSGPSTPLDEAALGTPVAQTLTAAAPPSVPTQIAATPTIGISDNLKKSPTLKSVETKTPTITLTPYIITATPEASATVAQTPTPVPTSTSTPPPTDPVIFLGPPSYKDTMDTGKSWYTTDDDNSAIFFKNGAMVLTGKTLGFHSWSMEYRKVRNAYMEGTFTTRTCATKDRYGIIFRGGSDYNSGYFLGLTCDGHYRLDKYDGEFSSIISAKSSDAILAGSNMTNRLGVMMKDNKFQIYINGKPVDEISDKSFPDDGLYGAFVVAGATPGFQVQMLEIAYWLQ